MSDEQTDVIEEEAVETYTAEQFNALKADNDSMKGKMEQLLGETKQAKAKARQEADEKAEIATAKALKDNDFEQLFKSSSEQAAQYKEQLDGLTSTISNEKRNTEAMKIAAQLADGFNAELLGEKIAQRLKYTDDGVKVLDGNGQLTVSTIEDLKTEFQNNERFASLLKGNQSSGGGASGGKSGSATGNIISRAEFDKLAPFKKMEFMKSGGKTTD
jgi:hypothetical protein